MSAESSTREPVPDANSTTAAPIAPSIGELDNLRVLLPDLIATGQWMCYVEEPRAGQFSKSGRPKMGKAPRSARNGYKADKLDPAKWSGFEAARDRAERLSKQQGGRAGVGFVFTSDTPWTAIDIDGAWEDGALTPLAERVLDLLPDAYTEISPSGEGLHVIVRGKPTKDYNQQRSGLELYGHKGFVTITGEVYAERTALRDGQAAIDELEAFLNEDRERKAEGKHKENEQQGLAAGVAAPVLLSDDTELLSLVRSSRQAARFNELWGGGGSDDASSGDLALCGMLAFWTGRDAGWMDRLFRSSGRMRDKWDQSHSSDGRTYGVMTLERAVAGCSEVYSGRPPGRAAARVNTGGVTGAGAEEARPVAPRRVVIPAAERSLDRDNEDANAERLVEHHGHELCYLPSGLGWHAFDGRRWAAGETRAIDLVRGVARYVEEEAVEAGRLAAQAATEAAAKPYLEAAKRLRKWRRQTGQYRTAAGALGLAAYRMQVSPDLFDTHDGLLNVLNGTLELATGKLRPHNPDDLLTQVAPVVWEEGAECSTWERVIAEAMPDPATRRELHKYLGFCLGGQPPQRRLAFFYGLGSNGKSLIAGTVAKVLGEGAGGYARRAASDLLMASNIDKHSTGKAVLRGSRLVIASEAEQGRRFATQALKELTGEDTISARLMRQDETTFAVHFKLVLMSNHRPDVGDTTDSFWDRLMMFPFTVRFDKPDLSLSDRLTQEKNGILRWLVEGYQLWKAEGFIESAAMLEAKGEYREDEDEVRRFLSEWCDVDLESTVKPRTNATTLWNSYRTWCEYDQGHKPMKRKAFVESLTNAGFEQHRTKREIVWLGISDVYRPRPEDGYGKG